MVEYRQSPNGLKYSTVYRKPMSVGLVAKICRISKKTVLNWIYRDALKAYTTYGGHYRIWPGDLKKFIVKAGIDVPFQFVDDRQTVFLIVDDDPAYTLLLKEAVLSHFANADVIATDDGYEALLLMGERKPHVVMLDLKMPKVDGFQVLELLRARRKDNTMKVIVLSAYLDSETRARLKTSVADGIWEKGMPVHEILRSLDEIVNVQERHKQKSDSYSHSHAD
ncbi:MAG: response regulator [Ignavibacteriae bacterium]|nr:response regulator [Ignavibacteria bacterium]MBI3365109.1 response regulator [Ignavibacteriota bacterium]